MNIQNRIIQEGFSSLSFPPDLVALISEYSLRPPKEYRAPFMEKYTVFISKRSWQDILTIAADRLTQLGCDSKTENFSLHCVFYNEQRCVNIPFHVNVFTSADSDDEYVVEFQKRVSGNTIEFFDLFGRFIQQDGECGIVSRTEGPSVSAPRQMPFEPLLLNCEILDGLLHLLKSEYYEIQKNGLVMLAQIIQTKANCVFLRRVPLFGTLICSFLDPSSTEILFPALIILKFLVTLGEEQKKNLPPVDTSALVSLVGRDLGATCNNLLGSVIQAFETNKN